MEIDPDGKILPTVMPVRDMNTQKPSGDTFGEIFHEFMAAPKKGKIQEHETSFIASSPDIQLKDTQPRGGNSVIGRAEQVLDILSEYQRKLADPALSLREISPLVRQLETCSKGLYPLLVIHIVMQWRKTVGNTVLHIQFMGKLMDNQVMSINDTGVLGSGPG